MADEITQAQFDEAEAIFTDDFRMRDLVKFIVDRDAKDAEIAELRSENERLKIELELEKVADVEVQEIVAQYQAENAALREKVTALEKQLDAANLGWA